jgi:hypothetical protein
LIKSWDVTDYHPQKKSLPETGEARKKVGIGLPRCLPPLKETFVGSLGPWFNQTHLSVDLALGHLLNP